MRKLTILMVLVALVAFAVSASADVDNPSATVTVKDGVDNDGAFIAWDVENDEGDDYQNLDGLRPKKPAILDSNEPYLTYKFEVGADASRGPGNGGQSETLKFKGYQQVEKTIPLQAYIPCYISMTVTGNTAWNSLESYGPFFDFGGNTAAEAALEAYYGTIRQGVVMDTLQRKMVFDNELGGFVDENWDSVGRGRNIEVDPATQGEKDRFILACDEFHVRLYSNDEYRYEVEGSALEPATSGGPVISSYASLKLDLYMRTAYRTKGPSTSWSDFTDWSSDTIFKKTGGETEIKRIGTFASCEYVHVKHQFKVPYWDNIAHGQYTGEIVLRAYTL